jgi:hypothetical protein
MARQVPSFCPDALQVPSIWPLPARPQTLGAQVPFWQVVYSAEQSLVD